MKRCLVAACLGVVISGCAAYDAEPMKRAAREGAFPAVFPSPAAALVYADALFAGGRVDEVRIGRTSYLVVMQHGSGVPVLGIAVYRRGLAGWRRLEVPSAPRTHFDFVRASAADGKIILTEERSRRPWVLYDPAMKR